MKTTVLFTFVTVALLSFGCVDQSKESDKAQPPGEILLANTNILSIAQSEIRNLGLTVPDNEMMNALETLGFKPNVEPSHQGWKVAHPLGHPWAISWVYFEMDLEGRVLNHRVSPGE